MSEEKTKIGYQRLLGIYIARDDAGNEFEKEVVQRFEDGRWLIDFGYPCVYQLDSLIKNVEPRFIENLEYTKFVLDTMGQNHKGKPHVGITRKDFLDIMKKVRQPVED